MSGITTTQSRPGRGSQPLTRFSSDERGSVGIMFGLMLMVMMTFVFASVDMGRWMQARKMTKEAIDSAELAGLKKYQLTSDDALSIAAAQAVYNLNIAGRPAVTSDSINFFFPAAGHHTTMSAQGNAVITMPFLQLINVPTLPLMKSDTLQTDYAVVTASVGANAGTSLEISMMIDITGSMNESDNTGSTKITTVKAAAQDLVDIVVWDDQSQYTSKVAVVPFSETVNLGTAALANSARGAINWGLTSPTAGSEFYQLGSGRYAQIFASSTTCVTERTGVHAYDDTAPSVAPVGRHYSWDGSCPTATAMMPLSSNKIAVKNLIAGLTAGGGTAGQMGTAWAWYALSPNFNSLWPAASAARPYSDMAILNSAHLPILQKIAILLTDGDYNTQYCSGVGSWDISCSGDNGSSQSQAGQMCQAMKNKGIIVYTIGAQVSSNARAFLQTCATDPAHYYDATDGNKLQAAFRDIASKLIQLHLTH